MIFDWAGTIVDFGSLAPVAAFAAAFEDARVPVSVKEIRKPMGRGKREHLQRMLGDETLALRWRETYGEGPTESDVDGLYNTFNRRLLDVLPRYAEPIPGVLDVLTCLRGRGVRIGSNSGYSQNQMDVVARAARERGVEVDCIVSASEVKNGRPAPDMSLACLDRLGLPADSVAVKVDDTRSGIEEGRNAGLWTVAVAVSGNELGLSWDEWSALAPAEQARLRDDAYDRLRTSNPDFIIDTVADLDGVLDAIEQ
ncbi:MAG TPA: phosphonoacetaldehyde hydrolase [Candidatus Aquilonibacter sp.]